VGIPKSAGAKIGNACSPSRPAYLADKERDGVGMAIYHLSTQIISRGGGRSVVAAQAYRAAKKIHDERLGKTFDFTRKSGVEHTEIMVPDVAPAWMKDRKKLWNAIEKLEKRKDAQLAREVQVALPKELSKEAQVELAREFVKEHFTKHGMVADLAVHRDNPENPHAHITLGMREVTEDGFGKKNREWNSKGYLMGWRESWEHCANRYLAREGHEQRVDHRSFADRGIQLEPTSKLGVRLENAETDGREIIRDRLQEHLETVRRNGEAILKDPRIALDAITYQQATFSKTEVGRWLNTRTVDAEQFNGCLTKVMGSDELVSLGEDFWGRERFTTREMLKLEKDLVADSKAMDQRQGHQVAGRFIDQAEATRTLTYEQKNAFRHIMEHTGDMAVVEGYAGTGKSYLLGAAKEAWEAQGYRVLGASLAGKAAEGLEISSGIQSRSIHAWEYAWREGHERLGGRDILVIDEAGMVGARQMNRVVGKARSAGAKVVLVGDTEQLQAIEAGAPMRKIAEEIGKVTIAEIRRQQEPWQRQATVDFATGKTKEGLKAYQERGFIHEHDTQKDAMDSVVEAWDKFRKEHPEKTQIMMAFKRVDVREMNKRARAKRRADGELGKKEITVETERGEREFSPGDRVYFLKNDRSLGVKNGSLGSIVMLKDHEAEIRLDGPGYRSVVVAFDQYNHLDHGYAATLHKGQGATVDQAHVMASKLFDRHTAYVGMTRHVDHVDLHWSREEFRGREDLYQTLCREQKKEMAVDYEHALEDNRKLSASIEKERSFPSGVLGMYRQMEKEEREMKKAESLGLDLGGSHETRREEAAKADRDRGEGHVGSHEKDDQGDRVLEPGRQAGGAGHGSDKDQVRELEAGLGKSPGGSGIGEKGDQVKELEGDPVHDSVRDASWDRLADLVSELNKSVPDGGRKAVHREREISEQLARELDTRGEREIRGASGPERDSEKGIAGDSGPESEKEQEKQHEKEIEKPKEHEMKIERGFGFDRGMGF
jgi:Ti-type conjugative transfer relaxase TraA